MLRDSLVATVTALTVVTLQPFSLRFIRSSDVAPDAPRRAALNQCLAGEQTVQGRPRDALAQLAAAGASVVVEWTNNWPYIERDVPAPINLTLRDATLEQWLQAISFQLGGPYPCYWVDFEGQVRVSLPHRQRPPLATRVYDVRDLLEIEARFAREFPRPNAPPPGEPAETNPLVFAEWGWSDVLAELAGGYTWIMKGGGSLSGAEVEIGDMDFRDGRLIVSHTPEIHRRIRAMLAVLRAHARHRRVVEGSR